MTKRCMAPRILAPILLVAAAIMIASPNLQANADQSPTATAEVKVDNFAFGPQSLSVKVGTTVTWTNHDDIPHTVVSSDGVFKSKARDTDETFSYKFDKAGTYSYFCSLHPKMTGQVVVQ